MQSLLQDQPFVLARIRLFHLQRRHLAQAPRLAHANTRRQYRHGHICTNTQSFRITTMTQMHMHTFIRAHAYFLQNFKHIKFGCGSLHH